MINKPSRNSRRGYRQERVRQTVLGCAERPRLAIFRSLKHVYAQLIDDENGNTLVSASTLEESLKSEKGSLKERAKKVGELVAQKGARGQFWDFHELMREIRRSYDPETKTSELAVLQPVIEADVLLLDDLGAWKMTDWMNDTLFYILNSRYLAKRATLITTNYDDVDPRQARQADALRRKEFLVDRIGQRLRSRLLEMCLLVRVEGTDHRQARQHSNEAALRGGQRPRQS